MKQTTINDTLFKAINQPIAYHIIGTEEYRTHGIIVEWIPKLQILNLPKGHVGCWKVHFPGKDGHDEVYISNTERVAARKKMTSEIVQSYIVKKRLKDRRTAVQRKSIAQKVIEDNINNLNKHQPQQKWIEPKKIIKIDYDREITIGDKFIATAVTVLYLLYPTVTRSTFKLVACQTVGVNRYLQMF